MKCVLIVPKLICFQISWCFNHKYIVAFFQIFDSWLLHVCRSFGMIRYNYYTQISVISEYYDNPGQFKLMLVCKRAFL